ncbi:MAG: AI-2E family transporter [Gammaproteobacteria bacterium]
MKRTESSPSEHPYEQGFLIVLIVAAVAGLTLLFRPFLPALALAVVIATATFPAYRRLEERVRRPELASLLMTLLVTLFVVLPLIYLLLATGFKAGDLYRLIKEYIDTADKTHLVAQFESMLAVLPLPENILDTLYGAVTENIGSIVGAVQGGVIRLFGSLIDNSAAILLSTTIVLFALFYFYRDGARIARYIRDLTPLRNKYDNMLMERFRVSASVLVISTLGLAVAQGASIALVTIWMDLPWFYLGMATAIASFIPAVGTALVWVPLSVYLYAQGHPLQAIFIVVWGAVVMGVVIDNLLRPQLITRLSRLYAGGESDIQLLDHTLLVFLSILGGLIAFGVLGLLYGPIIAAICLSIFDIYEEIHDEVIDRE